jgi:universal stress protein A
MKTTSLSNQRARPPNRLNTRIRPKRTAKSFLNDSRESSRKVRRILVPIDFSPPSIKALRYAVGFAEQMGATIYLVHVLEEPAFIHDIETFPLAIPKRELVHGARGELLKLAKSQIDGLVPVKTRVRTGKPFREIVALARQTASDLIIIATHGRTGLSRMLLGSTAELVVRHAPCPVFVIRDREK